MTQETLEKANDITQRIKRINEYDMEITRKSPTPTVHGTQVMVNIAFIDWEYHDRKLKEYLEDLQKQFAAL